MPTRIVAMKGLVEQDQITPMRIALKLFHHSGKLKMMSKEAL
jgi:hypothetical protein